MTRIYLVLANNGDGSNSIERVTDPKVIERLQKLPMMVTKPMHQEMEYKSELLLFQRIVFG